MRVPRQSPELRDLIGLIAGLVLATACAPSAAPDGAPGLARDPAAIIEAGGSLPMRPKGNGPHWGFRFTLREQLAELSSPAVDAALSESLDWLAAHQGEQGSWSSSGELGPGGDIAATSLALLAFFGAGETPDWGAHKEAVERGVRWLRAQVPVAPGAAPAVLGPDALFDQALAGHLFAEAYLATKNPLLRRHTTAALERIERRAAPEGGWRIDPRTPSADDLTLTTWSLLTLVVARDAGLEIDAPLLVKTLAWLDTITDPVSGEVDCTRSQAGQPSESQRRSMAMTALFSRTLLG